MFAQLEVPLLKAFENGLRHFDEITAHMQLCLQLLSASLAFLRPALVDKNVAATFQAGGTLQVRLMIAYDSMLRCRS